MTESFSIFILKVNAGSLRSAESFLRNRGWKVGSGTQLKEALVYLIQHQPEFLMIAADHPHKKVRILPKVLAQAFPVKIISYCDSTGSQAMGALNEMGLEYTLYPPVSGPAIERMVLKVRRDEEKKEKNRGELIASGHLEEKAEELIRLRGASGQQFAVGEGGEQARQALSQLLGDSDDKTDLAALLRSMPVGNDSEADGVEPEKRAALAAGAKGPKGGPKAATFEQEQQTNSKSGLNEEGTGKNLLRSDSIIVKGTQQALEESVVVNAQNKTATPIRQTSHCACIVVESPRFSGYLVAAMGHNRKIDRSFMETVKKKLFQFLRAHGEAVKNDEGMDLKLQEVDFEDWALDHAEFLRKSIHHGDEIAMAFFPTPGTSAKLEQSANDQMLSMDLMELKDDVIVEFDLYLYMPVNRKYLLYTPQGKPLYGDQKTRLTEKGVTKMHLRKESAKDVKKYRAQVFLNEKIQFYKRVLKGSGAA